MSNQIRYALYTPTNRVIHITQAERGLNCHCKCLDCGCELEAAKGDIREHYFRHTSNTTCIGETAIHRFGKQTIAESNSIKIPGHYLHYTNARIETSLDTKRPDVTVSVNSEDVHFEIRVSNAVKEGKRQFYCDGNHKCVEIDLSDRDLWLLSPEELKQFILEETYNKDIVYWDEEKVVAVYEKKSSFDFWGIVFFIGTILLIILAAVFFKRRKKRVFRY